MSNDFETALLHYIAPRVRPLGYEYDARLRVALGAGVLPGFLGAAFFVMGFLDGFFVLFMPLTFIYDPVTVFYQIQTALYMLFSEPHNQCASAQFLP